METNLGPAICYYCARETLIWRVCPPEILNGVMPFCSDHCYTAFFRIATELQS